MPIHEDQLQGLALQTSILQWIFRTEPLTGKEWMQIGVVAITVIIAVEIDKVIRRSKRARDL